ncbi:MAG: hypothetical protein IPK16_02845 [Anaerolineales bacterium]|nr:hypothetical protein [Anaerolineales bacterium]
MMHKFSSDSLPLRLAQLLKLGVALVFVALIAVFVGAPPVMADNEDVLYDDALAAPWANWSWDTTLNFANPDPVHTGDHALAVHFNAAWAGLYLHADPAVPLTGYTHLRFWLHGGQPGGQEIDVIANGNDAHRVHVPPPTNQWQLVEIPLLDLGSPTSIQDLYWHDAAGSAQPTFYLDDIVFTDLGSAPPPTPSRAVTVTVNAALERHPINPYIYGMNFAEETLAQELDLPVNRRGGNSMSRYNYLTDISNHASDWFFENIKESKAENPPEDSDAIRFIDQNLRTNTVTLLTIPMSGYVANGVDRACGFSVQKYGTQLETDPWQPDCGKGVRTDGSHITGNDPLDASIVAAPDFAAGWVESLVDRYGPASAGGVRLYNLDNEPDIWF